MSLADPSQPLSSTAVPAPAVQRESGIADLAGEIKALIQKLDVPKRKTVWDIAPLITTFLGTVVLAGISLFFTASFQRTQLETQRLQLRVEEMKAITALAPILASPDPATRQVGVDLLTAVRRSSGASAPSFQLPLPSTAAITPPLAPQGPAPMVQPAEPVVASKSLLDQFAVIALSSAASPAARVSATEKIGALARAPGTSDELKTMAVDTVSRVAVSPNVPKDVQAAAEKVLASLKRMNVDEAVLDIQKAMVVRPVSEVVLHHSGASAAAGLNPMGVLNLAQFQLEKTSWKTVSWHYAIAADGSVWTGTALNRDAVHVQSHNKNNVSVLLLLNGDKEVPTPEQQAALSKILRALFKKFSIDTSENAPLGKGFHLHKEFGQNKSCPGELITRKLALRGL